MLVIAQLPTWFSSMLKSYVFHRFIVAGFSFGVVILGARLIAPDDYTRLMLSLFLAKFLQIFNLGAVSGYFVNRYSKTGPLAEAGMQSEIGFSLSLSIQMLTLSSISLAVAFVFSPQHALAIISFIILIPIVALEPLLRYRRYFSYSLIVDVLLLLSFAITTAGYKVGFTLDVQLIFVIALFGLVIPTLLLTAKLLARLGFRWSLTPLAKTSQSLVVRSGFPIFAGSLFFALAVSVDRIFLPLHGVAEDAAVYFLAYQLAIGGLLLASSTNFINVVHLGSMMESKAKLSTDTIKRTLFKTLAITLSSIGATMLGAAVLEAFFLPKAYSGLASLTTILLAGLGSFFVAGSISPILAYLKCQLPITVAMGLVFMVILANNVYAMEAGRGAAWLAAFTALGLVVYGVWCTAFTFWQVAIRYVDRPH